MHRPGSYRFSLSCFCIEGVHDTWRRAALMNRKSTGACLAGAARVSTRLRRRNRADKPQDAMRRGPALARTVGDFPNHPQHPKLNFDRSGRTPRASNGGLDPSAGTAASPSRTRRAADWHSGTVAVRLTAPIAERRFASQATARRPPPFPSAARSLRHLHPPGTAAGPRRPTSRSTIVATHAGVPRLQARRGA